MNDFDFNVTLSWPGKSAIDRNQLPPVPDLREVWGQNGGTLIHADCLCAPQIPEQPKLIYLDPPFDMGTRFMANVVLANGKSVPAPTGFRDAWGINGIGYLQFMYHRLAALRDWLHADGLICVHIDQHANSRVRLLLDEVFGRQHLVNEIVWSYRSGGGSRKSLGHKHDTLYIYRKGDNYTFNPDAVRVPYHAKIATKRSHMFDPAGKVSGDVWDISRPPNHSKEWLGYPTQKPLALLERIINCFSNEGDLVADPFCGSGSLIAAAFRQNRRWIGIDVGRLSMHITRRRMLAAKAPFTVHDSKHPTSEWTVDNAEQQPDLCSYHPECLQRYPELAEVEPSEMNWCNLMASGHWSEDRFTADTYWMPEGSNQICSLPNETNGYLAFDALGYAQRSSSANTK